MDGENGFVDLVPRQDKPESVWLAFDAPFDVRPSHYFEHHQIRLILCDFTSAGNEWSSDNLYRCLIGYHFRPVIYPESLHIDLTKAI